MKLTAENQIQIVNLVKSYNDFFEAEGGVKIARGFDDLYVVRYYNTDNADNADETWSIGGFIAVDDWDDVATPYEAMLKEINRYESILIKTYKTLDNPRLFNRQFAALIGCSLK